MWGKIGTNMKKTILLLLIGLCTTNFHDTYSIQKPRPVGMQISSMPDHVSAHLVRLNVLCELIISDENTTNKLKIQAIQSAAYNIKRDIPFQHQAARRAVDQKSRAYIAALRRGPITSGRVLFS